MYKEIGLEQRQLAPGAITACKSCNRIFFYLAYALYFVADYVELYTSVSAEALLKAMHLCKYGSYGIFLLIVLCRLFTEKNTTVQKALGWFALLAVIVYQAAFHNSNSILMVLIISYAFAEDDIRKFAVWNLWLNVIMYFFTLLAVPIGLSENVIWQGDIKLGIARIRNSLGFNYPGQLPMSLTPIVFLYYYLRDRRISVFENIFWISMLGVAFAVSQTIMPILVTGGFILFFNIANRRERFHNPKRGQAKHCIPYIAYACGGITFLLTWLYDKRLPAAVIIDNLITGRLHLNWEGAQHFGISLFGSGYKNGFSLGWYLYLDSEYFYMLISNGILYTAAALWMWKAVIEWSVKANDRIMTLIFCFMAVNAIVNNGIYNLLFLPFIIVLYPSIESKLNPHGGTNCYRRQLNSQGRKQ